MVFTYHLSPLTYHFSLGVNDRFVAVFAELVAALGADAIHRFDARRLSGVIKVGFRRRADYRITGRRADFRFDDKNRSVAIAVSLKFQRVRAVGRALHD